MIRIRVDDFPQTKGEPQHTLSAFREFNRELVALTGVRYLLGVIPGRCTVEDILFLRQETDCAIGLHGINHDEAQLDIHGNEFPRYLSRLDIRQRLYDAKTALEAGVGRPVRTYMPPRNLIDQRTAAVLNGMFDNYTCGPETDREVMSRFPMAIMSMPPWEYGRTDEMLACDAHTRLIELEEAFPVLTLHWTWETNIGLQHMRKFFQKIPRKHFMNFDAPFFQDEPRPFPYA